MPTPCQRLTRSRSTTIASTTVAAGYSEIKMLASDSSQVCSASSMVDVGADVQQRQRTSASFSGFPCGSRRFLLTAADDEHHRVADSRANTSGQSSAFVRRLMEEVPGSARSPTPRTTVSQATFGVNRYGVTPSTVGLAADQHHRDQSQHDAAPRPPGPGRSPSATPTATGTAAFSTAASGETTEIGPAPSAAKNAPHAERHADAVEAAPNDRAGRDRPAHGDGEHDPASMLERVGHEHHAQRRYPPSELHRPRNR